MSAYSTMNITRDDAISLIMSRLLGASDEKVEDMLLELVGRDWLNNFSIVRQYEDYDENDYSYYLEYKNVKHYK